MEINRREALRLLIIERLVRKRMWGGKHTEHVIAGLPKHLVGTREVYAVLEELVRNEWLLPAKKTHETHYSLNPRKVAEIHAYYESQRRKNV